MDARIEREKMRVISKCEKNNWFFETSRPEGTTNTRRLANLVSSLEGRRRQIVERLLDRTLSSYINPGSAEPSHSGEEPE